MMDHSADKSEYPFLQGEGWGEDGFLVNFTRPIPTLILPLKGRKVPNTQARLPRFDKKSHKGGAT